MGTKNTPGKNDCYDKALPNEPLFVLLGRDACAARTVLYWIKERVAMGLNTMADEKILSALDTVMTMLDYDHRPVYPVIEKE